MAISDTISRRTMPFVRCTAYRTTDATVTGLSSNVLGLDAEEFDQGDLHDNSTANYRLTVPPGCAGSYIVTAHVAYSGFTAAGVCWVELFRSGTGVATIQRHFMTTGPDPAAGQFTMTGLVQLAVTDYVCLNYQIDTGAAITFKSGNTGTKLSATRVS